MEKKIKNKHCPHSNSSSGNKNNNKSGTCAEVPPIRPAGRIRSDQRHKRDRHRQETEQDRRFQITHTKKSPHFRPKSFPSATA